MGTKRHIQGLFVTDEIHIEHLGPTLDLGIMPFWGRAQKNLLPKLFCSMKSNMWMGCQKDAQLQLGGEQHGQTGWVRSRHLAIMGRSRSTGATSVAHEGGPWVGSQPVPNALGWRQQHWFPQHGLEQCPGSSAFKLLLQPFWQHGYPSSFNKPNYSNEPKGISLFQTKNLEWYTI